MLGLLSDQVHVCFRCRASHNSRWVRDNDTVPITCSCMWDASPALWTTLRFRFVSQVSTRWRPPGWRFSTTYRGVYRTPGLMILSQRMLRISSACISWHSRPRRVHSTDNRYSWWLAQCTLPLRSLVQRKNTAFDADVNYCSSDLSINVPCLFDSRHCHSIARSRSGELTGVSFRLFRTLVQRWVSRSKSIVSQYQESLISFTDVAQHARP